MTRKKTEKKESEHYYYNYLNGRKNSKYMDTLKFVKYIKDLFFNSTTSKWIPSKYKKFINRNSLDYKKCFETLSSLRVNNVFLKQKGYLEFLKSIEKYNSVVPSYKKIIVPIENRRTLLIDIEKVREKHKEHIKVNKKDFVAFILKNFDIGYTQKTLYKKFCAKEFEGTKNATLSK